MASSIASYPIQSTRRSLPATLTIFARETKYEFLKLWRTKSFSLSVIGFPVMFYLLFGVANKGQHAGGQDFAKYLLAGYCCFGMIGAALFGVGVGLAGEKAAGWLELKRSSPMPPMAYLIAKCITAQAFGLIITAILITIGVTLAGVRLTLAEIAMMVGLALVGTVPFAAMGLLVALKAPANAVAGIVNLIYLPMSFMGGPLDPDLPVAQVAPGHRPRAADLSPRSTHVDRLRLPASEQRHQPPLVRSTRLHAVDARRQLGCLPSRRTGRIASSI